MEYILGRLKLMAGKEGTSIKEVHLTLVQGYWRGYVVLAKSDIKINIEEPY